MLTYKIIYYIKKKRECKDDFCKICGNSKKTKAVNADGSVLAVRDCLCGGVVRNEVTEQRLLRFASIASEVIRETIKICYRERDIEMKNKETPLEQQP